MTKSTTFVKKNVALLTGGYGAEYDISILSAQNVENCLNRDLFNVYIIHIDRHRWYHRDGNETIDRNDFSFQQGVTKITFDCALIIIHGDPAENGRLQGYFESIELPISSCDTLVSALTFNKYLCNYVLSDYGILSARARLIRKGEDWHKARIQELGLPVFVKPNRNGSSYGITKVKQADELTAAIEFGFKYDSELIVEEYLNGREFTCGAIRLEDEIIAFPITEIISHNEYFDFGAKYENESDEITPAALSEELTHACKTLTKRIYKGLNCRGMVRVDYILKDRVFYVIEVNTIPGLTDKSLFPQQVEAHGWTMTAMLTKLINQIMD